MFSADPKVYDELLNYTPISFAFVDGLQFKDSVLSDLALMTRLNVPVICVMILREIQI